MIDRVDATHDPGLRSWIESANAPSADFPIQNLPFGVFRAGNEKTNPRIGVAIGDKILDVKVSAEARLLYGDWCEAPTLNPLMALSSADRSALRWRLSELLRADSGHRSRMERTPGLFTTITDAEMILPSAIGDYTDFYASIHHAMNVGKLFRPDNPLLPNYKWVPIGYHARASSVVVSGTPVRRPSGQTQAGDGAPVFGPTKALDYELEVGFFTGSGNKLGDPIPIGAAEEHIFGLCLVNDWSARDIQRWEYQPLGPFLSKSFATSISPWVVTLEALAPFRSASARPPGDPPPLPYLAGDPYGIDLTLEVRLLSECMKAAGIEPMLLSRGNLRDLYWTFAQLLTHHASNGCNIRPGDLIASGTVSGPSPDSRGCMLEITAGGSLIELPGGETRRFLADGDEVIMTGYAEREGCARIGFGECRGVLLPATGPEYRT
jgi:fumarylacetoacetase